MDAGRTRPEGRCAQVLAGTGRAALAELHAALSDYYADRRSLHARFTDLLVVPEMDDEIVGLAALEQLAARLVAAAV